MVCMPLDFVVGYIKIAYDRCLCCRIWAIESFWHDSSPH